MWYRAVGCIVTLTLSILAAPLAATGQQAGKIPPDRVAEPLLLLPRGLTLCSTSMSSVKGCASWAGWRARLSPWSTAGRRGDTNGSLSLRPSWSVSRWMCWWRRLRQQR